MQLAHIYHLKENKTERERERKNVANECVQNVKGKEAEWRTNNNNNNNYSQLPRIFPEVARKRDIRLAESVREKS